MGAKNSFSPNTKIESAKVNENFAETVKNKGAYNSGATYTVNDEVSDGGVIYRALATVTGVAPASDPTKWRAISGLVFAGSSDFNEAVDDRVGALIIDSATIDATYNDAGGTESLVIKNNSITTDLIATGGQISKEQLEYIPVTDVANGLAVTAATWTDVIPNQTFAIERADNRQVNVWPSGNILISTADATGGAFTARLLFDSAGSPFPAVALPLGGGYVNSTRPDNILTGAGAPRITGLGTGNHTVKLQVKCEVPASVYLRASTKPDYENFRLRVVEGKR